MAYTSEMIIEEVGVALARKAILRGGALPLQGAEWGFENALTTTWYPGNGDEATQQTLGPRELPSSWEGEWKRTMLPSSGAKIVDRDGVETPVFAPSQLRNHFEAMFRSGVRLRVTWRVTGDGPGDNDEIIREGRVKSAKFPHDRTQDIKWTVEFNWLGRGKKKPKPISVSEANLAVTLAALNAANANYQSIAAASKLVSINKTIRKSASTFTLGQLENLTKLPTQIVNSYTRNAQRLFNQVKQVAGIALKLRAMPFQIANNVVGVARNMQSQTKNFLAEMGRYSPEQLALKSSVAGTVSAHNHFGRLIDAAEEVARRASQAEQDFRAVVARAALQPQPSRKDVSGTRKDIIGIHVTKAGDTLISLSMKYYGDCDHVIDIARSNRLPWHTSVLKIGKPLVIPSLSTRSGTTV